MAPALVIWTTMLSSPEGSVFTGPKQLAYYALPWLVWAFYCPLIRVILRRWAPLENAGRASWLAVHALTFSVGWVGNELVQGALAPWSPWSSERAMGFVGVFLKMLQHSLITDLLAYAGAC